jgi:hypothetical protein
MAICLIVFLGTSAALPRASGRKRIGVDTGGVLRVRIFNEGGNA